MSAPTPYDPARPAAAETLRLVALIVAAVLISAGFVVMVQPFLVALALAAIAAGMARPLFLPIRRAFRGASNLAAAATVLLLVAGVVVPVLYLGYLVSVQAIAVADAAAGLVERLRGQPDPLRLPEWLPYGEEIMARRGEILERANEVVGRAVGGLASSLTAAGRGTALFLMDVFIFLYALFYFVQMDDPVLARLLRYSGLSARTQALLRERVASVSRATIKGTLLIGVAQGTLGALGFWAAGIDGAIFWGVVMAVFSVIPGLGAPLVIAGGVLWLAWEQAWFPAAGLALWGMLAVGTVDNLLRPALVGRDAKLHDILILVSTLGGLAAFGAAGLVLGPVLAGLFVAIWQTLAEAMAGRAPPGAEDPPG